MRCVVAECEMSPLARVYEHGLQLLTLFMNVEPLRAGASLGNVAQCVKDPIWVTLLWRPMLNGIPSSSSLPSFLKPQQETLPTQ